MAVDSVDNFPYMFFINTFRQFRHHINALPYNILSDM